MSNKLNKLNKLIWKEKIGQGAFGKVYKAFDPRFGNVAIKCLKKNAFSEKETLIELNRYNNSKYIIMIYAYGQDLNYYYIEMELVNGINLSKKILKDGQINYSQTQHYAAQIVKALDFIHGNKIIHRDLKPDNILITKSNQVKIIDFGLAKKLYDGELCYNYCGTYGYIPLEVYNNQGYNYSVDWYALGIIIYQMRIGSLSLKFLDYHKNGKTYKNLERGLLDCQNKKILRGRTIRIIQDLTLTSPLKRLEYARTLEYRSFFNNINWNNI